MVTDWSSAQDGRDQDGGFAEVRPVPVEQQGLRDALRNAFRCRPRDLPEELLKLLARLR